MENVMKRSWIWRHTPYIGRCLWHALGYLWEREWREAWHALRDIDSHIMWYVRALYAPYNRLTVRNVTRKYCCDADIYLIHAMFSVLCRHVERAEGGVEGLRANLAGQRERTDWPSHAAAWADAYQTMLDLYEWYTGVNWAAPVPFPREADEAGRRKWAEEDEAFWHTTCPEKMRELVRIHGFMWT
jgi:hypothetical protein